MPIPQVHSHVFGASLPFAEKLVGRKVLEDALLEADVSRSALEDPPLFIPLKVQATLANVLSRKIGNYHFAAIVTKDMPYEQLGTYAKYVLGGPTLGNSIERGIRGFKYIYRSSKVIYKVSGGEALLGIDLGLNNHVGASELDESVINSLIKLVQHFVGEQWAPNQVELRVCSNGHADYLEHLYLSKVHAGATISGIVFPAQMLELPNPVNTGARNAVLYRELRSLLRQYPGDRITDSTKQAIDLQLRLGNASIESVAERMNLGVRTLQRRLKAESESYQTCLDSFRQERAMSLLTETRYEIPEIAAALGFDEPNSFRRAFRKWTGIRATTFRRESGLHSRTNSI